jgi:hypothetical protein
MALFNTAQTQSVLVVSQSFLLYSGPLFLATPRCVSGRLIAAGRDGSGASNPGCSGLRMGHHSSYLTSFSQHHIDSRKLLNYNVHV